jgi:hypothetical protein
MKTLTWLAIILVVSLLLLDIYFALSLRASSHKIPSGTISRVFVTGLYLVLILVILIEKKRKQNKQLDED